MRYAVVAAPPGTGLAEATKRLATSLGPWTISRDVERVLCSPEFLRAHLDVPTMKLITSEPTMARITRSLPRERVIDLWKLACRQALQELHAEASSRAQVALLSCHLTLYSQRRSEFYVPAGANDFRLLDDRGNTLLEPDRVLVVIDDVYDMFARLTRENEVFELKHYIDNIEQMMWEAADHEGEPAFPLDIHQLIGLEARSSILSWLFTWRRTDMMLGEALARQFGSNCHFAALATKQLTSAAAGWIRSDAAAAIYLSHPISRPRRARRRVHDAAPEIFAPWPAVVAESNALQQELSARHGILAVLPTGIDEFRLQPSRVGNVAGLEARWPLLAPVHELLYEPPSEDAPEYSSGVFEPTPNVSADAVRVVLRGLENEIRNDFPFRDHLLVASLHHILVFRPLYEAGKFSDGVTAEIYHWRDSARTENDRRAAFFHHVDDVAATLERSRSTLPFQVSNVAARLGQELRGLSERDTDRLIRGQVSELDHGIVSQAEAPELRRKILTEAANQVWISVLTNSVGTELVDQVALVVTTGVAGDVIDDIARFLLGTDTPRVEAWQVAVESMLGTPLAEWARMAIAPESRSL